MDTCQRCFHCGLEIKKNDLIIFDRKNFCRKGCQTVYEIFSSNDLGSYYDFESSPAATLLNIDAQYDFTLLRI